MNGRLQNLTIQLHTSSPAVENLWAHIFAGWLEETAVSPDLTFSLQLAPSLPPLPATPPLFVDEAIRILTVYPGEGDGLWLHYHDGALLAVSPAAQTVAGVVTAAVLDLNGRFEDIIFTSLAPLLRRRGLFLAHTFAASKNGRCALLIGPSHSGKTTTGLNLLLHGWELLANDVVLLEPRPDGVYAWPTPGMIGIRPRTFDLLPGLQAMLGLAAPQQVAASANELLNGCWSAPASVATLFFPTVGEGEKTAVFPHPRAIALTQLMAESIDRWDSDTLDSHINCLEQLCQQTAVYRLQLGQDMGAMAAQIGRYSGVTPA